MRPFIKLMRIKEWMKNSFLFLPAFFAGDIFNVADLVKLASGALAFSFVASSIYIINDYNDRDVDRIHPKKKDRPIASGAVKPSSALAFMAVLAIIGFSIAFFINELFFGILMGYFIMNLLYSSGLKNVPILDLFIVALGFIFRTYSGGVIAGIVVSSWLAIMIFLLALFLIIAKRRDDLVIHSETGEMVRKSSATYNLEFINSCLTLVCAVIIVAYIMYTQSQEVIQRWNTHYLFATTIFVIAGIMRYLQIVFVEKDSGSPTSVLYRDKFILVTIVCWIVSFYIIIYAGLPA
jgi:decaprenyl-phosphate phosphoribosyltransferase